MYVQFYLSLRRSFIIHRQYNIYIILPIVTLILFIAATHSPISGRLLSAANEHSANVIPQWSHGNMKRVQSDCNRVYSCKHRYYSGDEMLNGYADEDQEHFPIFVWIWRKAAATARIRNAAVRDSVTDFAAKKPRLQPEW